MEKKKTLIAVALIVILSIGIMYDYGYEYIQQKKGEAVETLEAKRKILKKYESLVAQAALIEKTYGDYKKKAEEINASIIVAQTPALAAADLQNIISQIITAYGGGVRRMNIKKTESFPPFQLIQIDVDAQVPNVTALNDIIYDIEIKKPVLILTSLDIKIINYAAPTDLSVNLEISSLSR